MAHSNRQKLRDARGGRTSHQDQKANRKNKRSTFDADARIKELNAWSISRTEKQEAKVAGVKPTTWCKHESSKVRRRGALERLQIIHATQIHMPLIAKHRVEKEIHTLKNRI